MNGAIQRASQREPLAAGVEHARRARRIGLRSAQGAVAIDEDVGDARVLDQLLRRAPEAEVAHVLGRIAERAALRESRARSSSASWSLAERRDPALAVLVDEAQHARHEVADRVREQRVGAALELLQLHSLSAVSGALASR